MIIFELLLVTEGKEVTADEMRERECMHTHRLSQSLADDTVSCSSRSRNSRKESQAVTGGRVCVGERETERSRERKRGA